MYLEAWRRTGSRRDDLIWPVRETIAYLRREMTGAEGGFYASQDADSEGEEGTFYVWTPHELTEVLGAGAASEFAKAYGVSEAGNLNLLRMLFSFRRAMHIFMKRHVMENSELPQMVNSF